MKFVGELLSAKGTDVWSVTPEQTVLAALVLMAEKEVGALMVMEGEALVGIFSERDYARKVVLKGKSSRDTPVSEVMSAPVVTVGPDQSIEECMSLMTEKRTRHLPVLENEKLIGLISIGDVVKAVILDREAVIGQLEGYITGTL
ncbi:MAG: CBS domain-containing protein [Gammaproteobacteria bacterium]|jgi:CBS domain-containing protein